MARQERKNRFNDATQDWMIVLGLGIPHLRNFESKCKVETSADFFQTLVGEEFQCFGRPKKVAPERSLEKSLKNFFKKLTVFGGFFFFKFVYKMYTFPAPGFGDFHE